MNPGCATVIQISVPLWLPITSLHLAVVQKACMLLLAMLLVVLQYYKMLIRCHLLF